jgi:hypothetical protein
VEASLGRPSQGDNSSEGRTAEYPGLESGYGIRHEGSVRGHTWLGGNVRRDSGLVYHLSQGNLRL